MAGASTLDFLRGTRPREVGIGRRMIQDILTDALSTKEAKGLDILGRKVDLNQITPESAAALSRELEGAQTDTGFSGATEVFDLIDIPGALVRGLVGAGLSLTKGDVDEAGTRLLSALPGSENIPKLFGGKGVRAPEGSELLADVGWKPGTTAEDERRIRIAQAAGMSRVEAERKFATFTGKPLAFETQQEFDNLLKRAEASNPGMDTGITFEDTKAATDAQDFAGVAVEIALDPLTYLTFGASAAGKAARGVAQLEKLGAKVLPALKEASTFDDAAKLIRGLDLPGFGPKAKSKLLDDLADAYKGGKPDLDFGKTLAEQSRRGQLRAGFKIPFGPEVGPNLPTQGISDVLSTLGDPKLARAGREAGVAPEGVSQGVYEFLTETPVVAQVSKALRGSLDIGRKVAGKTGIAIFDSALKEGMGIGQTGVAADERKLTKLEGLIRDTARRTGVDESVIKATVTEAVETIKARAKANPGAYTVQSPEIERLAGEFAATLSRVGLKESDVAEIAAGIAHVNENLVTAAHKVKLDLTPTDDVLSFLHRHATEEGEKWLKTNKESSVFKARKERWRNTPIREINAEVVRDMGMKPGTKLFADDPIAATRKAVAETWRHVGNAYTATKIAERFGKEAPEIAKGADEVERATVRLAEAKTNYSRINDNLMKDIKPEHDKAFKRMQDAGFAAQDAKEAAAKAPKLVLGGPTPGGKAQSAQQHLDRLRDAYRKLDAAYKGAERAKKEAGQELIDATEALAAAQKSAKQSPVAALPKHSAADIYKALGLKVSEEEAARLAKVAIPEEIHSAVLNTVKAVKEPGWFLRKWRGLTNVLKATVTVLFPAFHGRNFLENGFKSIIEGNLDASNYQAAAKLLANAQDLNAGGSSAIAGAARQARGVIKSAAGDVDAATLKLLSDEAGFKTVEDFAAWASGNGLLENRFTSEFGIDMKNALKGRDPTTAEKAVQGTGRLLGAPLKAGFAAASGTENLFRLSMFIDGLKKGLGREGALNKVRRVFFDYRDLGNMESEFAKNVGFFYNFYRNNMRYLFQQALAHPQYTKQVSKLFMDDPDNPRWSWMSNKGAFKIGSREIALGFLPQQQFNMFDLAEGDVFDKMQGKLGDVIGQANPLIESGLSAAFGKDLFRNQPLEYVDRAPDWTFAPEWVQRMIGLRQTTSGGHVMSPKWRWAIDAIPALGRFTQSQISTERDRPLWQTMAQMLSGVRVENGDLTKDSIAALNRNIKRAGEGLPEMREDGPFSFRADRRTVEGRYISALTKTQPGKDDVVMLAGKPEYIGRLMPYITLDDKGEPVMNRLLVDKMHNLGMEAYPRHWAVIRMQQARDAAYIRSLSPAEQEAQTAFAGLFGGSR